MMIKSLAFTASLLGTAATVQAIDNVAHGEPIVGGDADKTFIVAGGIAAALALGGVALLKGGGVKAVAVPAVAGALVMGTAAAAGASELKPPVDENITGSPQASDGSVPNVDPDALEEELGEMPGLEVGGSDKEKKPDEGGDEQAGDGAGEVAPPEDAAPGAPETPRAEEAPGDAAPDAPPGREADPPAAPETTAEPAAPPTAEAPAEPATPPGDSAPGGSAPSSPPAETTAPTPAEPADPAAPADPATPAPSEAPVEPATPAPSDTPAEPATPAPSDAPAEPAAPADPGAPGTPAPGNQPAVPATPGSAAPAAPQPTAGAKPIEEPRSSNPVRRLVDTVTGRSAQGSDDPTAAKLREFVLPARVSEAYREGGTTVSERDLAAPIRVGSAATGEPERGNVFQNIVRLFGF